MASPYRCVSPMTACMCTWRGHSCNPCPTYGLRSGSSRSRGDDFSSNFIPTPARLCWLCLWSLHHHHSHYLSPTYVSWMTYRTRMKMWWNLHSSLETRRRIFGSCPLSITRSLTSWTWRISWNPDTTSCLVARHSGNILISVRIWTGPKLL